MIAHIHGKTGVQQPLSEHLLHTAEIAKEIGDSMNLGYLSFLTGYFHDLGKALASLRHGIEKVKWQEQ